MNQSEFPKKQPSTLSGFYQKTVDERTQIVSEWADLTKDEQRTLQESLHLTQADKMIENVIGRYSLPLGIGTNFLINGKEYLVPMVVEEPSVVAAVSYAAKLVRTGGGFQTGSTKPVMIAQIQLLDVPDPEQATENILAEKESLLSLADTSPSITKAGGGPVDIEVRHLPDTETVPMLIVHLLFDTQDAMGANAINTAAETLAPTLERLSGGRALLRILSNLTDQRRAWAEAIVPASSFNRANAFGVDVIQNIAHANAFAVADPYRATTHNKGILNGIDAVALATGNDWRAIESGAHAYAARDGQYRALTEWRAVESEDDCSITLPKNEQYPALYGLVELPLAVGTVGGATRSHPSAQIALKIIGAKGARELSEVMAAVGLAQNLAAIRALATEGIQRGHMSLHARQMAVAAGAVGTEVDRIAKQLVEEGQIRVERAKALLYP